MFTRPLTAVITTLTAALTLYSAPTASANTCPTDVTMLSSWPCDPPQPGDPGYAGPGWINYGFTRYDNPVIQPPAQVIPPDYNFSQPDLNLQEPDPSYYNPSYGVQYGVPNYGPSVLDPNFASNFLNNLGF
jgi:hypothetical protein